MFFVVAICNWEKGVEVPFMRLEALNVRVIKSEKTVVRGKYTKTTRLSWINSRLYCV